MSECCVCGRSGGIVNQCGCDPANMPTKLKDDGPYRVQRVMDGETGRVLTGGWVVGCNGLAVTGRFMDLDWLQQRADELNRLYPSIDLSVPPMPARAGIVCPMCGAFCPESGPDFCVCGLDLTDPANFPLPKDESGDEITWKTWLS